MTTVLLRAFGLGALSVGLATAQGCSDASTAAGYGNVALSTWGEDYIESRIPAEDLADGWEIRYSKFLIVIGSIEIRNADGALAGSLSRPKLLDMTTKGSKALGALSSFRAQIYPKVSFEVMPITADAELLGATESDRALMVSRGLSIYVEATVTKGSSVKRISWGFDTRTLYDDCKGTVGGKDDVYGSVVTAGGTDAIELTIHGDHFFYDDLSASTAKRRFDALASADKNGDGEVTLEELAAVKLVDIPGEQGRFGTGAVSGVHDLSAFVRALSRTVAHFRGEGECTSHAK